LSPAPPAQIDALALYAIKGAEMNEHIANPRVLVVDDERIIADTLALILNRSGFETTAVYSGEMAVEIAKALKPNFLISDVTMGTMSGIEAATKIRQAVPSCRVILFSGQAANADRTAAAGELHPFEILMKPVHPRVFLQRLSGLASTAHQNLSVLVPEMA
jgi:CheY-like chemotaxis protein